MIGTCRFPWQEEKKKQETFVFILSLSITIHIASAIRSFSAAKHIGGFGKKKKGGKQEKEARRWL